MRNRNLSNTSMEEYKCGELKVDIEEKLKPAAQCCIYRVPKDLRAINHEAYTPQLISIGPFHHDKRKTELVEMEKQKIRYKRDFGERITEEKWELIIKFIQDNEKRIRDCYAEISELESFEFITMIVYDAIFIIELLLKNRHVRERSRDFLLNNPRLRYGIQLDLQLLENQLPYFVLKKIYMLARPTGDVLPPFITLACLFFEYPMPYRVANERNLKHFIDLRRNSLVEIHPESKSGGSIEDLPSAIKLHGSGVKFKGIEEECLLNITYERKGCLPGFGVHELQIPRITIEDDTECLFRNLMALEQCHYPSETHICNYIDLMDFLINTEKDVDLLVDKGIISNCVGDQAAIAKMFNKLCLQITPSDSCYKDINDELKEYHKRWWNRTKETLKTVYFSNLWRGTATIAATILLVLTLLQTIYAML